MSVPKPGELWRAKFNIVGLPQTKLVRRFIEAGSIAMVCGEDTMLMTFGLWTYPPDTVVITNELDSNCPPSMAYLGIRSSISTLVTTSLPLHTFAQFLDLCFERIDTPGDE